MLGIVEGSSDSLSDLMLPATDSMSQKEVGSRRLSVAVFYGK